jgi:predicted secreted protein
MAGRTDQLLERLVDARGNRVVFLSHCMLDENVRYLGGAFHPGAVPDVLPLIRDGVGICQMPCPEMRAWGGVHKPAMLLAYGLRDTPLYRFRRMPFRLFVLYTRYRYRRLARQVANEIKRYGDAGIVIAGVVGIGGSPSCGVHTSMDLDRAFECVAACPFAAIGRQLINDDVLIGCRSAGEGLFVRSLRRRLRRLRIDVPFLEHDLIAEMRGIAQPLDLGTSGMTRTATRANPGPDRRDATDVESHGGCDPEHHRCSTLSYGRATDPSRPLERFRL